jgi:hypothetical protein
MDRRVNRDAEAVWVRALLAQVAAGLPEPGIAAPAVAAGDRDPGAAIWREAWDGLDLPPAPGAAPGFAGRIAQARAAGRERAEAPLMGGGWMRLAAAAALLAGVALGTSLSFSDESSTAESQSWIPTTLSEEYLVAIATPDTVLATTDAPAVDADATASGGEEP